MRLFEVDQENVGSLLGILNFLRFRSNDLKVPAVYDTDTIIDMVKRTGQPFDYASLVKANEMEPAVKNLIKSLNKEEVELNSVDADNEAESDNDTTPDQDAEHVAKMAQRAAKKSQGLESKLNNKKSLKESMEYSIWINGKPATKYSDYTEALEEYKVIKEKFPQSKVILKRSSTAMATIAEIAKKPINGKPSDIKLLVDPKDIPALYNALPSRKKEFPHASDFKEWVEDQIGYFLYSLKKTNKDRLPLTFIGSSSGYAYTITKINPLTFEASDGSVLPISQTRFLSNIVHWDPEFIETIIDYEPSYALQRFINAQEDQASHELRSIRGSTTDTDFKHSYNSWDSPSPVPTWNSDPNQEN